MSAEINGPLTGTPARKVATRTAAPRLPAVSGQQRRFEEALQQAQSTPSFAVRSGDTDGRSASWRRETIDTGRLRSQTSAARWDVKAFPLLTNGPRMVPSASLLPPLAPGSRSLGYAGGGQQNNALTMPLSRGIGSLSARFESGPDGIAAVGYDARGGTSYGSYQISSKAGTMERFLNYLEERTPEWSRRLKAAGPANTGSRQGAMPEAWRSIAAEDPKHFAQVQYDFINKTHYLPALQDIAERTGVNLTQAPKPIQETLWSTAVQHGANGAANIFSTAIEALGTRPGRPVTQDLIASVYAIRARQFSLSSPEVQAAVQQRFQEERQMALAMFANAPPKPA